MLLAIDVGNTNTVLALFDKDQLRGHWRMATLPHRTADEYAVWLMQVMQIKGITLADITGAIIASDIPYHLSTFRGCKFIF